jgi:hypothetical protein
MDVEEKESVQLQKEQSDSTTSIYKDQLIKAGCLYAFIVFDAFMINDSDLEKVSL